MSQFTYDQLEIVQRMRNNPPTSNDIINNAVQRSVSALCYFRATWRSIGVPDDIYWRDVLEDVCRESAEPEPPGFVPPIPPSIYNAGMRAYAVLAGRNSLGCSVPMPTVYFTTLPGAIGREIGVTLTPNNAACNMPGFIDSNWSSWVTHAYAAGTSELQPITTAYGSSLVGTFRARQGGRWIEIPQSGLSGSPGIPQASFKPSHDLKGRPQLPGPGGFNIDLPPIGVLAIEGKLADEINFNFDLGGLTLNVGKNDPALPGGGSPPSLPPGQDPPTVGDDTGAKRGDEPGDLDPEADYECFIITVEEYPANVKTQRPASSAEDIVWTGWYSFTYQGVESDRHPIDRLRQVVYPPKRFSGIAIGSYTGCRHSVKAVKS